MSLALDGTPDIVSAGSGNPYTHSLSTSLSNDIIIVDIETNGGPVVSVSGSTLGSFARRNTANSGSGSSTCERWWKRATSALSNETITVTTTSSNYHSSAAYAVSGGDSNIVWDSGTNARSGSTGTDPIDITTVYPDTMLLCASRVNNGTPTPGSGFTGILSGASPGYFLVEYKLVSSAGTYSATVGTGAGSSNGTIVDALRADNAGDEVKFVNAVILPGGAADPSTTSAPVDMTGADFFVAVVGGNVADGVMSDSLSNPNWTRVGLNPNMVASSLHICWNADSSSIMTFTYTKADYATVTVLGFKHVKSDANPYNVGLFAVGGLMVSQPGSITPDEDGELVITCVGENGYADPTIPTVSGYSTAYGHRSVPAVSQGGWIAYQIQTSKTATNPTWSPNVQGSISIASFKKASSVSGIDLVVDKSVHSHMSGSILLTIEGNQYLVPISDVSIGTWHDQSDSVNLWESINEGTPSDTDWIEGADGTMGDSVTFLLSAGDEPTTNIGHTVRYRFESVGGGSSIDLLVELLQGTTVISSKLEEGVGGSFVDGSFVLTSGEADTISDYSDLRLRFTQQASAPSGFGFPTSISSNDRYILDQNGDPWFIVADSAWCLFQNMSAADQDEYLSTRQSQGFNTILAAVLNDTYTGGVYNDGSTYDNVHPFNSVISGSTWDFTDPNETFWARVDALIDNCADRGITFVFLPIDSAGNTGTMAVANGSTRMSTFGQFLGNRYKNKSNIIWWHCNDYNGSYESTYTAVVDGIKAAGDTHLHLLEYTTGPSCYSNQASSGWTSRVDLDFCYPTGADYPYPTEESAYASSPTLPSLLGEWLYENNISNPSEFIMRKSYYWTICTGTLGGYFYGNEYIYKFEDGIWQADMSTTMVTELMYWADLLRQIDWETLAPDTTNTFLTSGIGADPTISKAALDPAGHLGIVYACGADPQVDMTHMAGSTLARWWNPVTGEFSTIGTYDNTGSQTFTRPASHPIEGRDYVLVLEA
jgi:Protein of unknown function (DUF4038)/Putative collagen-binding domain of a collagenase